MEYMLLIHRPPDFDNFSEDDLAAMSEAFGAFTQDAQEAGVYLASDRLQEAHTATVVSERDGEIITTDGPFAETKETLGGYYKIDVESIDEAIQWASRIPSVKAGGKIEVRPVWPAPVTADS